MKNKLVIFVAIIILMTYFSSCKRASINDPGTQGNPGLGIVLSGTANPTLMYIPDQWTSITSQIRVTATKAGNPYAGKSIIFEQYVLTADASGNGTVATIMNLGYFENSNISYRAITNSAGVAIVNFTMPGIYTVGSTFSMYIRATVVDDSWQNSYEMIPLTIVPYDGSSSTSRTYFIQGHIISHKGGNVGADVPFIIVMLSTQGGSAQTSVEMTDSVGNYIFKNIVGGWSGSVTPQASAGFYTTFFPTAYSYTSIATDYSSQDFIAE